MSSPIQQLRESLAQQLGRVVIGLDASVDALVIALVARGHLLVQGVPGLGKTLFAKSLARAIGGEFQRIQGTADLMPSDIIGTHVYDEAAHSFSFRPGPLFAEVVLMDEINRAGPKTQSALLEAMEERQVSVERVVMPLPTDFIVLATQNPREFEGTFPLPESQLDRFMLRIDLSYPSREAESAILARYSGMQTRAQEILEAVGVVERALLEQARVAADRIHVSDALSGYILDIAGATRAHPRLALGLSTRGVVVLTKAARIAAGLRAGEFVTPDDVKQVAPWVLTHRLMLTPEAMLEGISDAQLVQSLLTAVPVPR